MTPYILNVPQIRAAEQQTMKKIASIDLMEKAGVACANEIAAIAGERQTPELIIFCGTGNNGGDGLVIARQLAEHPSDGLQSVVVILCQDESSRFSAEFSANLQRWKETRNPSVQTDTKIFDNTCETKIAPDSIVVDALFGIGLNKQVTGIHADAIRTINASDAFVIAIDTPSGLFSDQHTPANYDVVMADVTLSIQFLKTVFMLPEAYPFYGEVRVMEIGMLPETDQSFDQELLIHSTVREFLHRANPYAHKGSNGHGLLIAGCDKMPGAALLAATAAMRGGIGKLTVHTTGKALQALPVALPEAILDPDDNGDHFSDIHWNTLPANINAIAIGPGLGTHRQTVNAIKNVLDAVQAPLIVDADALNMLADNKTWIAFLPSYSILTPHFREFEKLAGPAKDDFDRIAKARAFAQRHSVILILKGQHTVISLPDGRQFFNSTGNEGMATAGSGDVLTGLLLAILAQGYNPVATAFLGVYLHGLAGDLYAQEQSVQSLIASDLPNYFGKAFRLLSTQNDNIIFQK